MYATQTIHPFTLALPPPRTDLRECAALVRGGFATGTADSEAAESGLISGRERREFPVWPYVTTRHNQSRDVQTVDHQETLELRPKPPPRRRSTELAAAVARERVVTQVDTKCSEDGVECPWAESPNVAWGLGRFGGSGLVQQCERYIKRRHAWAHLARPRLPPPGSPAHEQCLSPARHLL